MGIQTTLVALLFVAAVTYLAWRGYRSLTDRQAGCSKGCGCEADTATKKRATAPR